MTTEPLLPARHGGTVIDPSLPAARMSTSSGPSPARPHRSTGRRGARPTVAERVARVLTAVLGPGLPLTVTAWDDSTASLSPEASITVRLCSRTGLRYLLASPDQLGLARAYVTGELVLDGDLDRALSILAEALDPPAGSNLTANQPSAPRRSTVPALLAHPARLADLVVLWGGPGLPPARPATEARLRGARHSRRRDRQAIGHHYDLDERFYQLLLGSSLTYSCAYWTDPTADLLAAQTAKHDLIAAKLGLRAGHRLLDIGCGWGSFLIHAATRYGIHGVGVTLSEQQARSAGRRVRAAGVSDRVRIEHADYRDLADCEYDAIASVGMAEHVGTQELDGYAGRLQRLLAPGGRLLHHAIATRDPEHHEDAPPAPTFMTRYVFPDGQLQPLNVSVSTLERAGLDIRDVQALREHYPPTLRAWRDNLRADWAAAVELVGLERARVWDLYLAASAIAFRRGSIGVNQILAVRPRHGGDSGMPLGRPEMR